MSEALECAVVIPCLNEEATIGLLVTAIRRHIPNVFVVDDGSTDRTARFATRSGSKVLRHARPFGKGAALQTGWREAAREGFRWVLCMDGDGQHSPQDIPTFLNRLERTGAPLIVGNRMHNTGQMPPLRRFVNHWMSGRISRIAGHPLPDSQCGFRLMNLDIWATLPICATHFEIESDMLLAFAASGCRIDFVPIQVIYKNEQSKIHPIRDTIRWIHWWRNATRAVAKFRAEKNAIAREIKAPELLKSV
jgi:glycosyltransferase involved in cell wall biosynthesis